MQIPHKCSQKVTGLEAWIPSFHTAWDQSCDRALLRESTQRSSNPTVVKSDNPIITPILNGLFRSEVSQATVCTASPSALTRLCRFMQITPNPWNGSRVGQGFFVSSRHCSEGGREVKVN